MKYKSELLIQMADNLNIHQFSCEQTNSYVSRILYSAIANWIYASANDVLFEENYKRKGVSKSYITRRISKIAEEYLTLYPMFHEYLDGKETNEVVSEMREMIEDAGFLTATGFDEFMGLPPLKEMMANDGLYLVRGLCRASGVSSVGLGIFTHSSVCENSSTMKKMFYLPEIDAASWTQEYINSMNWGSGSIIDNELEYFDPLSTNTFSRSWIDSFPKNIDVTLYKKHDRDYGFAQRCEDGIKSIPIPDHLIGVERVETDNLFNNDVRRFMYGLKALNHNKANLKLTLEKDVGVLQLFNALPRREFIALQFMGWPMKNIGDNFRYYIPLKLLQVLKELLLNLNILIEEINHG